MDNVDFSFLSRINRDIQDALIVLDTKGNIIYSNPAASQHLGIKAGKRHQVCRFDCLGCQQEE